MTPDTTKVAFLARLRIPGVRVTRQSPAGERSAVSGERTSGNRDDPPIGLVDGGLAGKEGGGVAVLAQAEKGEIKVVEGAARPAHTLPRLSPGRPPP